MPALIVLCLAQFMVILDITVVRTSRCRRSSPTSASRSATCNGSLTTFTLAFGGLLLLGGRAGDLLGRRRMCLTGLAVFTGASLAAAARVVSRRAPRRRGAQGVGAALLSPAALSLDHDHVRGP